MTGCMHKRASLLSLGFRVPLPTPSTADAALSVTVLRSCPLMMHIIKLGIFSSGQTVSDRVDRSEDEPDLPSPIYKKQPHSR